MSDDFRSRAVLWRKGNLFEDFTIGQRFDHHWGRTLNEGDNSLFSTLTLHFNPMYFNKVHAQAHGHRDVQVNPLLVFNTVLGLSVEDLSEAGGPFVGVEQLVYGEPVYPGDTLSAHSTTIDARLSDSKPGFGIVTWRTEGLNQTGAMVVRFQRANLVMTSTMAHMLEQAK